MGNEPHSRDYAVSMRFMRNGCGCPTCCVMRDVIDECAKTARDMDIESPKRIAAAILGLKRNRDE